MHTCITGMYFKYIWDFQIYGGGAEFADLRGRTYLNLACAKPNFIHHWSDVFWVNCCLESHLRSYMYVIFSDNWK